MSDVQYEVRRYVATDEDLLREWAHEFSEREKVMLDYIVASARVDTMTFKDKEMIVFQRRPGRLWVAHLPLALMRLGHLRTLWTRDPASSFIRDYLTTEDAATRSVTTMVRRFHGDLQGGIS